MKKVLLGFAIAALFASCSKDEVTPVSYGNIMVVHTSPDAPNVDLLLDNNKINQTALSFPNNTGYLQIPSGTRNFKVNVAGTTTTVINADLPIEKDKSQTLFAIDSVSILSTLLLNDDLTAPAMGKSHVRFVHLSPDAPAVDIALVGGAVVFPNVAFKGNTAFTPLDAGTYNLEVRVAGTSTVALTLPPITVENGRIYTVFAKGFLGGSGTQALDAAIIVNK